MARVSSTTELQSVEALYQEHHSWLRGWLGKKLGCSHSAADLAQDTYLRLLVSGHIPDVSQSRCHLTQIAKGLVVDLFRRRRIEAAYLESLSTLPEPETPSVETRVLVIETLIEIDRLLHGLPNKVRRAFLMCKLDGLSYREIADELGVSVSSVEKYIAQALVACYQAVFEG